jgi:hypothetical protein
MEGRSRTTLANGRRGRLAPLVVFLLVAALGGCGGSQSGADDVTALADAPLLEQPNLDVVTTGLVQQGERLLMSAVIANRSKTLDAREAVVVLASFDSEGRPLAERPRTLLSIPAASSVAVTASAVLEPRAVAARVTAHVGLPDAAVTRAADPLAAPAQGVQVRAEGDAIVVSGLVDDVLYPVPYTVDVVLSVGDQIVAGARGEFRPSSGERSKFVARGPLPSGVELQSTTAVVTILPTAGARE